MSPYDVIVIGSGPGGYVAAIRAAQLGLKTAVIEKESPGGVCLNWGCIPSKALLKSAKVYHTVQSAASYGINVAQVDVDFPAVVNRSRRVVKKITKGVEFLLKKNNVDFIIGTGRLEPGSYVVVQNSSGEESSLEYKNAIIATGARARTLPTLPIDGSRVLTSRHALALKECPKKLLVVGAGAIGIELAYFFNSFGAETTVVELQNRILPVEDEEISASLQKSLKRSKMDIKCGTTVESLKNKGSEVTAVLQTETESLSWSGDFVLVSVGVQGNVENIGLEKIGIRPEKSFINTDDFGRTSADGVYAIGDVKGAPWLAHVASHEGIIAVEHIAGLSPHPLDHKKVPACTYCSPQVASIGLTERAAKEAGLDFKVGKFPFSASGLASAIGQGEGFVKVIIDSNTEEILGTHIIHPEASELIGEPALAFSHEATASSVLETVHAHPTLSEALMEAMGDALNKAVHI